MVPKPFFKKIDHLGIAVPSLTDAVPLYEALLGQECEHVEEVADQQARTAFFSVGESHLELVEPTADDSPLSKFLAGNKGRGGLHHICVEVQDIEGLLALYKARGVRLIDETPRKGAHGKLIAFVHPKSTGGVLLELSQPADPE
jgi:methylmalonyl-CoA/ethylmalonyl-CoA epimerase